MPEKTHKLAAIVFTDIVGYTKRMEENEQKTMQLLQQQREVIFPLVESHGGEVIKEIGDGLLIMFDSAVQAVRFAISAQTRLKDEELTIRAGIHIGDVIIKGGDVFGSAVNTAARIEPLASPNGICISDDVMAQLHNKSEFISTSMGKKDLKGVKGAVEVYELFIEGVSEKRPRSIGYVFKDLWSRNVIQILGGYVVSAWIIKQAVAAIISRYMLSPHLIELAWILLISMIPTVLLLAYFHGKRSSGKWTKIEIFGLPANILFSILLLVFLFKGKELGATTTSITIENEEGKTIERTLIKSEFRKKIALYNFTNLADDTTHHWIQYTIPTMLEYNLSQDLYIDSKSAVRFFKKLIEAGYKSGIGLPLTIMRKFAEYYHLNYFLTGDFLLEDGVFTINMKLYKTSTTKLISKNTFTGENIFELMDEISTKIKEDVGIPDFHLEESSHMPIAEIFTGSYDALKYFAYANREIIRNDYVKGIAYAERAVEEDPGFAVAYLSLAGYYFNSNQAEKSIQVLEHAMDNIDDLPESVQFYTKFFYYLIHQEADKADAVIKMWVELYPEDTEGHAMLAGRYIQKGMVTEAIAQTKMILKLDPEEYNYLRRIGSLYKEYGKYDSALIYYQLYADQFPRDYKSYQKLGELFLKTGDLDKATENFERALLIEDGEISIMLKLGDIGLIKGDLEGALKTYNNTLSECKTAEDSADVYRTLQTFYELKGQFRKAIEYQEKMIAAWRTFKAPKDILVHQTFTIGNYIKAGQKERGFQILENNKKVFEPPLDKVASFGYLFAYLELKDAENALKVIKEAEELIEGFGEQLLMANIYYAKGKIYEIKEDYAKALTHYQQFLEAQPAKTHSHRWIARCYRKLGEYKEAKDHIEIALKEKPYNPGNNHEAGFLFLEIGKEDKALEYLNQANEVWIDADADYEPAIEVRTALAELDD